MQSIVSTLALALALGAGAATPEFTALDEVRPVAAGADFEFDFGDRFRITIPDDFMYEETPSENAMMTVDLHVFQLDQAPDSATAHTLMVQVARLNDKGRATIDSIEVWLAVMERTNATGYTSYRSRPVGPVQLMGRSFVGRQFLRELDGVIHEGVYLTSLQGSELLIVRAQENDPYRSSLPWLHRVLLTLREAPSSP